MQTSYFTLIKVMTSLNMCVLYSVTMYYITYKAYVKAPILLERRNKRLYVIYTMYIIHVYKVAFS